MTSNVSIRAISAEPDFICVPSTRWLELRGETRRLRDNCESMSLALMATGHDLRQGLHRLLRSVDKLTRSTQPAEDRERIQGVKELISGLADDFENLAQLAVVTASEGSTPLIGPVSVRPILLEAYDRWRSEAQQKGLGLRMVSHNVMVSTNAYWFGVIVSNIIGNAVRHTMAGEVSIESMLRHADWILTVRDTGPGIGESDLRHAFDSAVQPRIHGGGLGLSIVRRAVGLLGHGLCISTPSKGTTVSLRITVAEEMPQAGLPCANQFRDAT
jgi:two-component system sensor histidine kinase QseC